MKRTLLLSLVSALSCSAAFVNNKVTVVETVTPVSPWALEVSIANVFATKGLMGSGTKKFNLAGPEMTLVYSYNKYSAFTLRGSALYGRHGHAAVDETAPLDSELKHLGKLDLILMPGYRYTRSVSPRTSVFAGANFGFIFTDINKEHTYNLNAGGSESAWGFAASAEIGVKYDFDQKWYGIASYQFSGDTARPTVYGRRQTGQMYHGFRVGVGHQF